MRIYAEESFGPVVTIVEVEGVEEAVRVRTTPSTACPRPCSAPISTERMRGRARLQTGICHINDTTVNDEPQMPFGGVKASGWGRFGGRAAVEEFTELRWITVQDTPRHYPI